MIFRPKKSNYDSLVVDDPKKLTRTASLTEPTKKINDLMGSFDAKAATDLVDDDIEEDEKEPGPWDHLPPQYSPTTV
jgi:hypothetical protein